MDKRIILLIILLLIAVNAKKKKAMDIPTLRTILLNAGFPAATINLFIAQCLFESPGLQSPVAIANNNLTGIKYNSISPKGYANSTPGTISSEGDPYAKFTTYADWAKCYHAFMYHAGTLTATNADDFARKLKAAAYFQSDETQYANGMKRYLQQLA